MKRIMKLLLPIIMCLSISFVSIAKENSTYLSDEVQEICVKYGEQYGICPELLMSIIERESAGQSDIESGGCKGLMQISDRWHTERMNRVGVTDIYDMDGNIHVGADYLAELFEEYGEVATVLMVYHGEEDAVTRAENGEISKYADWILNRSAELERWNGK